MAAACFYSPFRVCWRCGTGGRGMTLREFIAVHPEEALDVRTPDGRIRLEPKQVRGLLRGERSIACDKDVRHAAVVQAEDLLKQEVCSAYRARETWRLATACGPVNRKTHTGMMEWRLE